MTRCFSTLSVIYPPIDDEIRRKNFNSDVNLRIDKQKHLQIRVTSINFFPVKLNQTYLIVILNRDFGKYLFSGKDQNFQNFPEKLNTAKSDRFLLCFMVSVLLRSSCFPGVKKINVTSNLGPMQLLVF